MADKPGAISRAAHDRAQTYGGSRGGDKAAGYPVGRGTSEARVSGGQPPSDSGWWPSR